MDLKKCINNHYYDSDKYSQCPHCASKNKENKKEVNGDSLLSESSYISLSEDNDTNSVISTDDQKTDVKEKKVVGEWDAQEQSDDNDMGGVTVGYFQDEVVVGWLVAIEGVHRGEAFNLKEGMNFVGRSTDMDICLIKDQGVSRKRHITIIYDARNNEFVIHVGESKELVYVNDELLLAQRKLQRNNKISLGKTVLMFIPLCDENFMWE